MFKTFVAEFKHIFANKWRAAAYIILIFIPFIYGFFYMNAFWNPFGRTQNLPIAIVNLDRDKDNKETAESQAFKNKVINSGKSGFEVGGSYYKLNVVDATSKASDLYESNKLVENNKYFAVITIPKGYSETLDTISQEAIAAVMATLASNSETIADLALTLKNDIINKEIAAHIQSVDGQAKSGLINFYNSFKHSYLAGEMTNFGSGLTNLSIDALGGRVLADANNSPDVAKIINALKDITDTHALLNTENAIGKNINSYGFGLSPYFLSIGLWVGALAMTFMLKNERHIKTEPTLKHYFGKSLVWIFTGWMQTLILFTAVTIQGVHIGQNQWMLYGISLVCSTLFCLIVQAVFFTQRYGDLGEFAVVVILVLQLVSSSGTFPVDLQLGFFRFIHHIAPFTYSILAMRETFWAPNAGVILQNLAWLLCFIVVLVPASVGLNYHFDRRTFRKTNTYQSFEIELDDY